MTVFGKAATVASYTISGTHDLNFGLGLQNHMANVLSIFLRNFVLKIDLWVKGLRQPIYSTFKWDIHGVHTTLEKKSHISFSEVFSDPFCYLKYKKVFIFYRR